jgi:Core binding factor beta subunit
VNELVQKLTQEQRIIASLRPEPKLEYLKAAVDRGYVLIKFTETRGGTELGIRMIPELSKTTEADFENGKGTLWLSGDLTLDYVPVRFHGHIDLESLEGTGRLEIREEEKKAEPAETTAAG